jgi:methionine-rich copper-binding protein CopC
MAGIASRTGVSVLIQGRYSVKGLIVLLAGLVMMASASAHTALSASTPESGAKVAAPVTEIVLEFSGEVRLTAMILSDAAGADIEITSLPKEAAARFVVALAEPLDAGAYRVTWRAVGEDTHIVSGEVPFSVAAP